ncbi:hypothetical protein HYQ45_017884 [Verticillium longisporum]|uniref:Uncharacterized protein n=1 Tax=Verticillium longisporum TaxID=100787 RepID=A0A8I2Z5U1_VERLO|nr:hypothetical protein HYQ45_017884 [Verticillium longisporum]
MTPNSRIYGIKHESSGRDAPSFSNVPGDSAAEAKANNEWQTGKMEDDATCTEITRVRGHLDMSDEEVNRSAEKRTVRSGEKKLLQEATISNRALAAAHSDHANRGSHTLYPPITDDTMIWRDRRVAGPLVRAPQDDSDSDEFRFDNIAFLDNDNRLGGPSQVFHPNLGNGKADWKFPRNDTGSASCSSESSSTKAPQPAGETPHLRANKASNHVPVAAKSSCQTSWDAMTIQEKLRFLDAFFDNDAPIDSHLPPLIKEQQILYDQVFAKALAVPSEHAETPHLKAERDAARAKNKAAGDRISTVPLV